jgi:hypothetical protein
MVHKLHKTAYISHTNPKISYYVKLLTKDIHVKAKNDLHKVMKRGRKAANNNHESQGLGDKQKWITMSISSYNLQKHPHILPTGKYFI